MVSIEPGPLVIIPEERQQRELRSAEQREAAERPRIRNLLIPLGIFTFWQIAGAVLILASAHVGDVNTGKAYFAGGFAVGYGGAFFHLMVYYIRGRERDDW